MSKPFGPGSVPDSDIGKVTMIDGVDITAGGSKDTGDIEAHSGVLSVDAFYSVATVTGSVKAELQGKFVLNDGSVSWKTVSSSTNKVDNLHPPDGDDNFSVYRVKVSETGGTDGLTGVIVDVVRKPEVVGEGQRLE